MGVRDSSGGSLGACSYHASKELHAVRSIGAKLMGKIEYLAHIEYDRLLQYLQK